MSDLLQKKIAKNRRSKVVYYKNGEKRYKTYKSVSDDIDTCVQHLNFIKNKLSYGSVGILGNVSYDWLICDLACIKAGVRSIALPEYLRESEVNSIIREYNVHIVLLDYDMKDKYTSFDKQTKVYYINCPEGFKDSFWLSPKDNSVYKFELQDEYGLCFSSGTTGRVKPIKLKWPKKKSSNGTKKYIDRVTTYFWSKKRNRIIIYMPFSHFQQREFVFQALLLGMDIILSDPINCIKHIIINKPNIMISVPRIYELIALRIEQKLKKLPKWKQILFSFFKNWKINERTNYNPIKIALSKVLFNKIKKLYGGNPSFLVCGSAPVTTKTLNVFYSIGVKVLEAYGQSELGMIAMNTKKNFKIGSVGIPMVDVVINEESEVLVRYNKKRNIHNADVLNINDKGFIHTGDLGYLDTEGFLFLKGRKDNVIVLISGKKIFPEEIELRIKESCSYINQAYIFSLDGIILRLVVTIDNTLGSSIEKVKKFIVGVNSILSDFQRITLYHISEEAFSSENNLLTATLKMKRDTLRKKYEQLPFHKL